MSRFRFGDIVATVTRLGTAPTDPGNEEYSVRLDHPDGESWIESKIRTPRTPRTAGFDYRLAFNMLGSMWGAVHQPGRWLQEVSKGGLSPEELAATVEMAVKLEPYLQDAIHSGLSRAPFYSEHWESKKHLGISSPPDLPRHIRTKEDVANFFAYLFLKEDLSFHPDEDFNTYVNSETGGAAYTMEEAHERNRLMAESFEVMRKAKIDIYGLGLWISALLGFGDPDNLSDVPTWLRNLSETWIT